MTTALPFQVKRRLWYLEFQFSNYLGGEYLRKSLLGRVLVEERDVVGLECAQGRSYRPAITNGNRLFRKIHRCLVRLLTRSGRVGGR